MREPSLYSDVRGFSNVDLINSELTPIGFPFLSSHYVDPTDIINKRIIENMRFVDLIPCGFSLNFLDLLNDDLNSKVVHIEYDYFIREYQLKLAAAGINHLSDENEFTGRHAPIGVRAFITGDSSGTDTISNTFVENVISGQISNMVDSSAIATGHAAARSAGVSRGISVDNVNIANANKAEKFISSIMLEGRHVSLPEIWQKSDYENSFSFKIKISSPYGDTESVKKFIINPLIRIICLVAPTSLDGITYGNPPYVYMRAYGLSYMVLGIPKSLSISRGEGRINKYKQPLDIELQLEVKNAFPGFGAYVRDFMADDFVLGNTHPRPGHWRQWGGYADRTAGVNGDLSESMTGTAAISTVGSILKSFAPVMPYFTETPVNEGSPFSTRPANTTRPENNAPPRVNTPPDPNNLPEFINWVNTNFASIA